MPLAVRDFFWKEVESYDHIIWDWNGTLLNDVDLVLDVLGTIMEEHGLPATSKEAYRQNFGFPIRDYYLSLGFDLEKVTFEVLSVRFHELYNAKLNNASLFKGVIETLELISDRKCQSILSAAAQWHLEELIRLYGIDAHFTHVFGIDNEYADSKLARGQELIKLSGFALDKTILIGDTFHDYEVANELGIESLIVADGHQEASKLIKRGVHVFDSRFVKNTPSA